MRSSTCTKIQQQDSGNLTEYRYSVNDLVEEFNSTNYTNYRIEDLKHISFNPFNNYIELVFLNRG